MSLLASVPDDGKSLGSDWVTDSKLPKDGGEPPRATLVQQPLGTAGALTPDRASPNLACP